MRATLRPQPFIPDQNVARSVEEESLRGSTSTRGYSDSMLPKCRTWVQKEQEMSEPNAPLQNDLVAAPTEHLRMLPQQVRARQNMQLPSFKSLGISSRLPDALLTPPDESTLIDLRPSLPTSHRSSSFPQGNMPKTPSPDLTEFTSASNNMLSASEASSSTKPAASIAVPVDEEQNNGSDSVDSENEEDDTRPHREEWLTEAVDAVVENMSLDAMGNVVNILCHSQPCPLSREEYVTTAFPGVVTSIQNKIGGSGRYIDVVHAVPIKFNMTQIPSSPATTPSARSSGTIPNDYFSMNVFAKAVVAMDHHDALNTSVPSSPHPVVAPSSIGVSLLERFIPPSSAAEYIDLFSSDAPSVLVDRLFELSSTGGSLIYIYPTASGATTFATKYLGPLLDPLLRTMVGIHGLSADFGAGVGKMAAVDKILPFDGMLRKISVLLRKLNRGSSVGSLHPVSKYKLIQSSTRIVQLDRKVWTEWWTHQEKGRISTVVDRYFQRGYRLPMREGVTAGALVREILDGIKSRDYADYDAPREGVEVGVFVIKRSA